MSKCPHCNIPLYVCGQNECGDEVTACVNRSIMYLPSVEDQVNDTGGNTWVADISACSKNKNKI